MRWIQMTAVTGVVLLLSMSARVYGHCQIPCGIYGDEMRFEMLQEHITTVEKSMNKIRELEAADKPNWNQLVRWIDNKEAHAAEMAEIVTYYFMTQRVKPAAPDDAEAQAKYVREITLLHATLIQAMKAKQTTDLDHVARLRELVAAFRKSYLGKP